MKRSRSIFAFAGVICLLVLGAVSTKGQQAGADKSRHTFEVQLHFVLGSDSGAAGPEIPKEIRSAIRRIGKTYAYADYRLASSQYQMVYTGGQIQSDTILKNLGGFRIADRPIYANWSLGGFMETPSAANILTGTFRFTARVPSKIGNDITYNKIQYVLRGVALREERPTVIGTLPVPESDELIFFVLNVSRADR